MVQQIKLVVVNRTGNFIFTCLIYKNYNLFIVISLYIINTLFDENVTMFLDIQNILYFQKKINFEFLKSHYKVN